MEKSSRKFFLIAIGGTAMTPLAALLVERGETVEGSDILPLYPPMSDRLEALGIDVLSGFNAQNVKPGIDHVVAGNLARRDNPEILEALRLGLNVKSMPRTLHDEFLCNRHPIVVTGTHGKTTTTALTAWILASAGRAPGYLIGGEPVDLPGPSAMGKGGAFVVEGDEYSTSYDDKGPKFLHYAPQTLIVTSIEFDHADLYPDLPAIIDAFRKAVELVPPTGLIVANGCDPAVLDAVREAARARVVFYGTAMLEARNVSFGSEGTEFDVVERGTVLFHARTRLAGKHNVENALAAIGAAREQGLTFEELAEGLATFRGVKRRLEEKGTVAGITVIDDFAHHPTAVGTTIAGALARYPGRRLWSVFEPRSITGGRSDFFDAYLDAFSGAHAVALVEPYHATRLGANALDVVGLASRLAARGIRTVTGKDPATLREEFLRELREGDVVLVMSSGSFGGMCGKILEGIRQDSESLSR